MIVEIGSLRDNTMAERTRRRSGGAMRHVHNIPGTKLVKRFIKLAKMENTPYKDDLKAMRTKIDIR